MWPMIFLELFMDLKILKHQEFYKKKKIHIRKTFLIWCYFKSHYFECSFSEKQIDIK